MHRSHEIVRREQLQRLVESRQRFVQRETGRSRRESIDRVFTHAGHAADLRERPIVEQPTWLLNDEQRHLVGQLDFIRLLPNVAGFVPPPPAEVVQRIERPKTFIRPTSKQLSSRRRTLIAFDASSES